MRKLGEILKEARLAQKISTQTAAKKLLLKEEVLTALEEDNWESLPEKAYIAGFIKNYADFLSLDSARLLALFRGQYDERKFPQKAGPIFPKRRLMFTPNLIIPTTLTLAILIFGIYLLAQYTSVLSAPKLEIITPPDDQTTTAAVVEIAGVTEKDTTVSIDGQLIPVNEEGKFSYQVKLQDGRNMIEVIASKKLSPKTKKALTIRLSR